MKKLLTGFTLVELLVVMAILGVLVTLVAGGFRSSQARGRDAERKSDLKNIANALELYYSDYGVYPASLSWGTEFTDGRTVYFKTLPQDIATGATYYYRVPDTPTNQKFQLFAHLENSKDPDCINANCAAPGVSYSCGTGKNCNFAITSPNTNALE